jgi:protein-tyrosine kinase
MLASAKVKQLMCDLRDRYKERIVIFDLPPLLNVDDAISVLPNIDCALMVVGNGMVTSTTWTKASAICIRPICWG